MDRPIQADDAWDAGDMGCGELVSLLAQRVRSLAPGQVLDLTTTDLGAPHDIPAWCRLTENRLLAAVPPHYFIRKKES